MKIESNPHKYRSLIHITLAIAALAICGCLYACTRTDQKPVGSPEKVTIAVVQSFYPALILIAKSNNYFRDEGLDVTVQLHQTGVHALDALFAGNADLASTAETPVMFAITGGRRLAILADTFISDGEMAIVARKDRGIVTPSDLKGKKIAVSPRTVGEYFLHSYLTVNGISSNEVMIVKLATAELMDALISGKVDAASSWNPPVKKMQKELGAGGVTFTMDPPHSLISVLTSRPDLPSQKPEIVKKMLRALIKAENFVRESPQESIKIAAAAVGMEPDQIRGTWASENFHVSLDQSLVLALEAESRWAIKYRHTETRKVPNYLDLIYFDGLKSVKPEAVRILR